MADQNTGLPIRSQADGTDERVHSKIVDFADPGGTDKQLEVSEKLAHIRNFGQDPAGLKTQQRLSENGEMAVDGTYDGTSNTNPANIGIVVQERNAAASDVRQTMKPTAVRGSTDTTKVALDIALNDPNGNAFSPTNPLPVSIEESPGTEIINPNTSTALAANASASHDYTVTALKTFLGETVWTSGSGKIKTELKVETGVATGVFTTIKVGFNSTANPNIDMAQKKLLKVAAGVKIRITITNLDNQAQNVYSTLEGIER